MRLSWGEFLECWEDEGDKEQGVACVEVQCAFCKCLIQNRKLQFKVK